MTGRIGRETCVAWIVMALVTGGWAHAEAFTEVTVITGAQADTVE